MNQNYFGVVFQGVESISNVIMPFAIVTAHNPMDMRLDEFKNNEIFKASDTMVDSLTHLIAKKRAKNGN